MKKSFIPHEWQKIESAPMDTEVMLRVTNPEEDATLSHYKLPFPCKLTADGWVNAKTGSRLTVRAWFWQPYRKPWR
jgi:hypothetical protein